MLPSPADLVDPDLEQVVQPVGIELIGAHAGDDPPDGVPVDPRQPLDRGLLGPGRQPRDELLEIAGEPARVSGERNALDPDAVLRALQAAKLGAELEPPDAEVQVAPGRLDPLTVVPVRRGEIAQWAAQPPAPQRHPHHDPVGLEPHPTHPDPIQAQQARESRVDAHRRPPCKPLDPLTASSLHSQDGGRVTINAPATLVDCLTFK